MGIKPDSDIANDFYKACQLVIDIMIRDDIHALEYGQPFRSLNTQTMCAIIMELAHQDAMTRIEGSNIFTLNPSIYRLYYTRYYLRLIDTRNKEKKQMFINVILAVAAVVSSCAALFSNCVSMKKNSDAVVHKEENKSVYTDLDCQKDEVFPITGKQKIMPTRPNALKRTQ